MAKSDAKAKVAAMDSDVRAKLVTGSVFVLTIFHEGVGAAMKQVTDLLDEKGKENITVDELGEILATIADGYRLTGEALEKLSQDALATVPDTQPDETSATVTDLAAYKASGGLLN